MTKFCWFCCHPRRTAFGPPAPARSSPASASSARRGHRRCPPAPCLRTRPPSRSADATPGRRARPGALPVNSHLLSTDRRHRLPCPQSGYWRVERRVSHPYAAPKLNTLRPHGRLTLDSFRSARRAGGAGPEVSPRAVPNWAEQECLIFALNRERWLPLDFRRSQYLCNRTRALAACFHASGYRLCQIPPSKARQIAL